MAEKVKADELVFAQKLLWLFPLLEGLVGVPGAQ
jgi:hypothetical protein